MPAVKDVGEPCERKPHARFDGGREESGVPRLSPRALAPPAYPTVTQPRRSLQRGASRVGRHLHWSFDCDSIRAQQRRVAFSAVECGPWVTPQTQGPSPGWRYPPDLPD